MIDAVRQEVISQADTVVVKVGTNVLTREDGVLEPSRVQSLADQLQRVRSTGRKVVLVSSGAIGAGMGRLGLGQRPTDLRQLQGCAAVGQSFLMRHYEDCLTRHGILTAQILLTAGDFDSRSRYLNTRNTISTLLEWGCLPIINENDTVSVAEIKFGDNDHLAAMVTNLLRAPLLILLTVVDGLYSSDPGSDPDAKMVPTVAHIDRSVLDQAGQGKSSLGSGGMRSKLRAARQVTAAGECVIMANGAQPNVLDAIFALEPVGTLFLAHNSNLPSWKRWLGYTVRPHGRLIVNPGAREAVLKKGRSLLPVGILEVEGNFGKGAVVSICDSEGIEFARGLTNYPASTASKVRGLRTDQIRQVLGQLPYEEAVHRDNMAIIE